MKTAMDACENKNATSRIKFLIEETMSAEDFGIFTSTDGCMARASGVLGFRRAIFWMEDQMAALGWPALPKGEFLVKEGLADRISRSPLAPYRWMSGWELDDDNDYYPDEYLNSLAHCGMNAIWVAGLLRNLVASKTLPELGPKEHKLAKLRALSEKAMRHGIKTFLFCVEPRILHEQHPLRKSRPDLLSDRGNLCTSTPEVRDHIEESMCSLFEEAPLLDGVINIFNGERYTTCWVNESYVRNCPRCSKRSQADVISESLNCFMRGIKKAKPTGKLLAWSYAMLDPENRHSKHPDYPRGSLPDIMEKCDPDIIWMCNFEHGGRKTIHGKETRIFEYSLSYDGPSETFQKFAAKAREMGRTVYAKLQTGATYELPSAPWIPVPGVGAEKTSLAIKHGAKEAMFNWMLGGWPSPILKATGDAAFLCDRGQDDILRKNAAIFLGPGENEKKTRAWKVFEEALSLYPFNLEVLYRSPVTRAPAYHLTLEKEPRMALPYNWGIDRGRAPQPFENDTSKWRGEFSCGEIVSSFREMGARWKKGVELLVECSGSGPLEKETAIAEAVRIQFLSCANTCEFYMLRETLADGGGKSAPENAAVLRRMREVADDDANLARQMTALLDKHPALGYHPETYDFSYGRDSLEGKIRQTTQAIGMMDSWLESGEIDFARLNMTVEETFEEKPDRWGD